MPNVLIWIGIFVFSLTVLVFAADYFTRFAQSFGIAVGIPPFTVGVLIVALGTSIPELASSIAAVASGASEMVAGNVIGSNIANILAILGVTALVVKRLNLARGISEVDVPFLVGASLLFYLTIADGTFNMFDTIILLGGMAVFVGYTLQSAHEKEANAQPRTGKLMILIPLLILSASFVWAGAHFTILSVIKISHHLRIGTQVVAMSAVALGTSLPELVVSISAARKGQSSIVVGNVVGSNVFNIFAVMGIPSLFGTITITPDILTTGLPILLIATFLMYVLCVDNKVSRWEGMLLLLFYGVFLGRIFFA